MLPLRDALRDLPDDVFFDLHESDEEYLLVMDVPGATPASLEVAVDGGRVSIEAHREKRRDGDYTYLEENRSLFVDADLPLPIDAAESGTEATVERGVLELRVPKRDATKTTIEITAGDQP
jgi:HSP20 family molecular chaperone IbpA